MRDLRKGRWEDVYDTMDDKAKTQPGKNRVVRDA